jgi:FixH.
MSGLKKFFHWGNVLLLVFVVFATGISTLAYKSCQTPVNLVTKNYYEEELRYQDKIDQQNNAAKLSNINISQDENGVNIIFPKEITGKNIKGDIYFYCVADGKKDLNFKITVDSTGKQTISNKEIFPNTSYKVKLTYKADSTAYFSEKDIRTN